MAGWQTYSIPWHIKKFLYLVSHKRFQKIKERKKIYFVAFVALSAFFTSIRVRRKEEHDENYVDEELCFGDGVTIRLRQVRVVISILWTINSHGGKTSKKKF